MADENTSLSIIRGPGKLELMLALFDRNKCPEHKPRTVYFRIFTTQEQLEGNFNVIVTGVSTADENGEVWDIEGIPVTPKHKKYPFVRGRWNSEERTGHMHWAKELTFKSKSLN